MKKTEKRCADCRDGDHANYDQGVRLVVVKDPDTGKLLKRAYMCHEHRDMYEADGWTLIEKPRHFVWKGK